MNKQGKIHHMPSTFPSQSWASTFEPSGISIPVNVGVIWFNEDDSPQSVTFNDTSPEAIESGDIAPGGFFIHKFTVPGTYDYYNSENPQSKGRINVGGEFESGQYEHASWWRRTAF